MFQSAIEDFDLVIKNDPNDDDALNTRGLLKAQLNMFQSAIEDFKKAIQINPKNKLAIENKIFYEDQQIKENRLLVFKKINKLREKIKILEENNDYKNIIDSYEEIIELDKQNDSISSFPYSAIAFNYEKIGKFDEAIKYQLEGIKLKKNLPVKIL